LTDPTPVSVRQLRAFLEVAARELTWVLPNVRKEVRHWRARALGIPDGALREDAILTLDRERLNTEGAALFAVLSRSRNHGLLRVLAAFQIILDYLDTISEQPADDPLANGRQLHLALTEALDPGGPVSDYYRYHPWQDDGGYLRELVELCRRECEGLPGFRRVRERVMRAAELGTVQILNHDPVAQRRDDALRRWTERELPEQTEAAWFELTAAASSSLWVLALLALGADADVDERTVVEAELVYFPWICAASTLLDAFVDQPEDAATGNHSYVAHYDSPEAMTERLAEIVFLSASGARQLRNGERHALITTGMVAMYLSKASARSPELRGATRQILAAAGSLPRMQMPIMRIMRALQGLGDA
jgi:tetraprenyl-beta-curcumene synthase